jgi:organic hydroperoxide reductase OsmC/OhrA
VDDHGEKSRLTSRHVATVSWARGGARFTDNRYSRRHAWRFDGGVEVPGSSSPHSVPLPYSSADAVDPEEAFVASIASCHMLWFLSIAAQQRFVVTRYRDAAEGTMAKNDAGKEVVTRVVLKPAVTFGGERVPTDGDVAALHHAAHDACFLANSVRTAIDVEGTWDYRRAP